MDTFTHDEFDRTFEIFNTKFNDITNYYYFNNAFSEDECNTIIQTFKPFCRSRGTINGTGTRRCDVAWIARNSTTEWIYDRMCKLAKAANNSMFNFDITHLYDKIQFTKYDQNDQGCYAQHMDVSPGSMYGCRKLSITVQLSHENSYAGGDLLIRGTQDVSKKQGTVAIFPSFLEHEVIPVTAGVRYSLVLWLYGPQFR